MANQIYFSKTSPNFVAQLVIAALGIFAGLGVIFPKNVNDLGNEIVTSFSTGGQYALITILFVSVAMPIVNWARTKPQVSFKSVLFSPNTLTYLLSAAFSGVALLGVNVPDGAAASIVSAVFARDWASLATIITASVVNPLIRFLIDKKAASAG